jgi:pyruvate carboxylase
VPFHGGAGSGRHRQRLEELGPKKFAGGCATQKQVLVTDTTMRDGHQSLLATRMRTYDIAAIAGTYARALPQLLSLECWGGATFDVSMRFLTEDPWERLAKVREGAQPALADAAARRQRRRLHQLCRTMSCKPFRQRRRPRAAWTCSVCSIASTGSKTCASPWTRLPKRASSCEGAMCYTGDFLDPERAKYDLKYYVGLAKDLEKAGAHILAVKDMAGLLKPAAARVLFKACAKPPTCRSISTPTTRPAFRRHGAGGRRNRR